MIEDVLPYLAAISPMTGFSKVPPRPSPKGAQASSRMPYLSAHVLAVLCWLKMWVST